MRVTSQGPAGAGPDVGESTGGVKEAPLRLGGMALGNGLLLQTKTHWVAAIRTEDGSVEVASGAKSPLFAPGGLFEGAPLVRGTSRLVDALLVLVQVKRRLKGAVLPVELPEAMSSVAAATVAVSLIRRFGGAGRSLGALLVQETAVALFSAAPAVVALRGTKLARYHGAEHKSIGAYENKARGRTGSQAAKEHDRCGSNLVGPLLVANVLGSVVVRRLFREPPPGALFLTGVASLGVAMEAFRYMSAHPERPAAKAMLLPGRALQRFFTTEEPDEAELEVGRAALDELLRLEGAIS